MKFILLGILDNGEQLCLSFNRISYNQFSKFFLLSQNCGQLYIIQFDYFDLQDYWPSSFTRQEPEVESTVSNIFYLRWDFMNAVNFLRHFNQHFTDLCFPDVKLLTSLVKINQGIRIKGRKMALVWHEKASRRQVRYSLHTLNWYRDTPMTFPHPAIKYNNLPLDSNNLHIFCKAILFQKLKSLINHEFPRTKLVLG